jgi:hypothetical protein
VLKVQRVAKEKGYSDVLLGCGPQQISGRSIFMQYFCCESMILHIAILVFP